MFHFLVFIGYIEIWFGQLHFDSYLKLQSDHFFAGHQSLEKQYINKIIENHHKMLLKNHKLSIIALVCGKSPWIK